MKFRKAYGLLPLIVLLSLATLSSVASANQITNPSFESGLTGWTTNPAHNWFSTTQHAFFGSEDAASGAGFNCGSTNCLDPTVGAFLYQDFATTIGQTYTIGFDYLFGGGSGLQELDVYFGGTLQADIATTTNTPQWTHYSFDVLATSSTTRLEFTQVNLPDFTFLDNVSADIATTSTPEPGTWAMLATGMVGLFIALRRRNRTAYRYVPIATRGNPRY